MFGRRLRVVLLIVAVGVAAGALAGPSFGAAGTAACRGSTRLCFAVFSLGGGASGRRITVRLPAADLRFLGANARPGFVHGAYMLSGGRFTDGGSRYTATLDAVQSIPRGARLILSFGHPQAALRCGGIASGASFITVSVSDGTAAADAFSCAQAREVARTWTTRFRRHRSVRRFSVNQFRYRCRLVPLLPQNMRCDGGRTRVRFSGATG